MPEEPDDFYGSDAGAAPKTPDANSKTPDPNSKTPDQDTALLPKSLFPGKPPAIGDVCQFKVEHIWEDEVEVSYVKEGGAASKSTMDTATDSFDQMASAPPS